MSFVFENAKPKGEKENSSDPNSSISQIANKIRIIEFLKMAF